MHDIFIVNYTNNLSLLTAYPHAQIVQPMERLALYRHVAANASTKHAWVVDNRYDYSNFDFEYEPLWHQDKQLHVWQSREIRSGDVCLLNAAEFLRQADTLEKVQEYQHICWHSAADIPLATLPAIVIWNFGNNDSNLGVLQSRFPDAKVLRYFGTHLDMLKKSAAYVDDDFWVLSSCCEYNQFDPAWKPSWEEEGNIHCWASGTQKFGDTFYVNYRNFMSQADTVDKLEYFSSIYWKSPGYARLPWPVNYSRQHDLLTTLKSHSFSSIYEYFVMPGSTVGSTVDPCLWEKRHLIAYNRNGHVSLCPRDCVSTISNKVNNYPYIQYHTCENSTQKPQDIVFVSYDEKNADLNYEILKKRFPNAVRSHGVDGLVNAHKKAVELSTTPWVYLVFAKTQVADSFNFDFNPNYLDIPSNYVFYSYNSILNHSYGHDGIVMYHAKSVIDIQNWGIDFTMSFPVVTIPVISCYNAFNYNEYSAWRTAIREAYKLKKTNRINDRYHLHLWLTSDNDKNGIWSMRGAKDGLDLPNGLEEKINNWRWLRNYFDEKYSKIIEQT